MHGLAVQVLLPAGEEVAKGRMRAASELPRPVPTTFTGASRQFLPSCADNSEATFDGGYRFVNLFSDFGYRVALHS